MCQVCERNTTNCQSKQGGEYFSGMIDMKMAQFCIPNAENVEILFRDFCR